MIKIMSTIINLIPPEYKTYILYILPILLSLYLLQRRRCDRFPIAPGYIPLLGHAISLAESDEFLNVLNKWTQVGKNGVYEFSLFGKRWVVLCTADSFMEAMKLRPYKVKRANKMGNAIESLGVHGLFNAEGNQWKIDRRIVGPTLNKNHLQDYFHHIKLVSNRLIRKWDNEKDGTAREVVLDLSKCSLDITALSILGIDFNSLNNSSHELANDIEKMFEILFKRTLSPMPFWKIPFCDNLDGGRDVSERIFRVLRELVWDYKKQKEQNGGVGEEEERAKTCLQKLIDISDDGDDGRLDEDRVIGNLLTLLIAGTDTTSTTLAACLWEIANDCQLQKELYQEVAECALDLNNLSLKDVMNRFPRLHSLLFEVLRCKGPAPFFFLEPNEPVEIKGQVLKPGTIICALTRNLGEKAASEIPLGPNSEGPELFCPRRWLIPGQSDSLSVTQPTNRYGGYMPFGNGVRVCPGASMAKAESITVLFHILQWFELAPIANHPLVRRVARFTDTFDNEIQLTLKPRP